MIVFVPDELEAARWFAREAVAVGSANGGGYDWNIAMIKFKIALGYEAAIAYEVMHGDCAGQA